MKNIFFTNLCWRNCKSCPPEEAIYHEIILTDGICSYRGKYHPCFSGFYIKLSEDGGFLPLATIEPLNRWWWTDIMKHIRREFGGD